MNKKLNKFFSVIAIALFINAIITFEGIMICIMFEILPLWEVIVLTFISLVEAYLFVRKKERLIAFLKR